MTLRPQRVLLATLLLLAACHGSSLVLVELVASDKGAMIEGITRLHVTVNAGSSGIASVDYSESPPINIPPTQTFGLRLPGNVSGPITINVEAFSAASGMTPISTGGGTVTVASGKGETLEIMMPGAKSLDAGAPDLVMPPDLEQPDLAMPGAMPDLLDASAVVDATTGDTLDSAPTTDDGSAAMFGTRVPVNTTGSLVALWGSSTNDVYALSGASGGNSLFHITNNGGSVTPSSTDVTFIGAAISGTGPKDIYVVGQTATPITGAVTHYDGTSWTAVNMAGLGAQVPWYAVWSPAPGTVFIGGKGGTLVEGIKGQWSPLPTVSQAVRTIWGTSAMDFYVGTDTGVVNHTTDGATTWNPTTLGNGKNSIVAIWGSSTKDVYAVDSIGNVYHSSDGMTWGSAPFATLGAPMASLWGAGPTDVYAAGGAATNGAVFYSRGTPSFGKAVTYGASFVAVWGTSASDVWIAASDGYVFHGM